MTVFPHNIPQSIKDVPQWIVWQIRFVNGEPTKVPINPMTGYACDPTSAINWQSFDVAYEVYRTSGDYYAGVSFCLSPTDPFVCIDVDSLHDEATQEDRELQAKIIGHFNSYTELSPSGNGYHIWILASIPAARKRAIAEMYGEKRHITFTGNTTRHAPIQPRQIEAMQLWSELKGNVAGGLTYEGDPEATHSDDAVIHMASGAKNGDLFSRLFFEGDWSGYAPNKAGNGSSEADFALTDIIAFWSRNKDQTRRLFFASALGKREKYVRTPKKAEYAINKAFDRMLPPIDVSAIAAKITAAVAGPQAQTLMGAQPGGGGVTDLSTSPPVSFFENLAPVFETDDDVDPESVDGFDLTQWRRETPRGLVNDIAEYVYRSSPRPVYEISLTAAIGMMAGICGQAYNVSGTGLNLYLMLLANTGTGKEGIKAGISRLTSVMTHKLKAAEFFIGPGAIASGQALLKYMSTAAVDRTTSFVSVVGEIGLRMQQISGPHANAAELTLKMVLLDLFNKSGATDVVSPSIYSDKQNNTEILRSPAFTMLGESVPEEFYKAFDEGSVSGGLLPRFIMVEYDGPRPPMNQYHMEYQARPELIMQLDKLYMSVLTRTTTKQAETGKKNFDVINIPADQEALARLNEIDQYADMKINTSTTDVYRHLWNRAHVKVLKLAGLLAVGIDCDDPVITRWCVDWAASFIFSDIVRLSRKFQKGIIGGNKMINEQEVALLRCVQNYMWKPYATAKTSKTDENQHRFKVINKSYIMHNLAGSGKFKGEYDPRRAMQSTLTAAIEAGYLVPMDKRTALSDYDTRAELYVVGDVKWLNTPLK